MEQKYVITFTELNAVFNEMAEKSKNSGLDPYAFYIQECRKTESDKYDSQGNRIDGVESHHINPKHKDGNYLPDNLLLLTVKEHIAAHWIRWRVFNDRGDKTAVIFRIGDTKERRAERLQLVQLARERDRINKTGFFSRAFQQKQGRKGGKIGGTINTIKQYLARQKVGLCYGRETGIKNQKDPLKKFLSCYTIWAYSSNAQKYKRKADRND